MITNMPINKWILFLCKIKLLALNFWLLFVSPNKKINEYIEVCCFYTLVLFPPMSWYIMIMKAFYRLIMRALFFPFISWSYNKSIIIISGINLTLPFKGSICMFSFSFNCFNKRSLSLDNISYFCNIFLIKIVLR